MKKQFRSTKTYNCYIRFLATHLMCASLMFWQVPTHALSVEDVKNNAEQVQESNTGTAATSTSASASTGASEEGGVQVIEGEAKDTRARMLITNIALFAAAASAPVLAMKCWKPWSTKIYVASAALYVANEVGLFTRHKKGSSQEMKAYLGRGDEDRQIEALRSAAEQTRKAKEAAERRSLIAKIAATGFAAASAMAVYENWKDGLTGPIGKIGCGLGEAAPATVFQQQPKQLDAESLKIIAQSETDLEALITFKEQHNFLDGKLSSIDIYEYEKIKTDPSLYTGMKDLLVNFASISSDIFVNNAFAESRNNSEAEDSELLGVDWGSTGTKLVTMGLGGAAAAVMATGRAIEATNFMKHPMTRAVGFAGFSVFSFGASTESASAARSLESNAKEYDELANSLQSRVNQQTDVEDTNGQLTDMNTQSIEDANSSGNGNNEVCVVGGTTTFKTDENCECKNKNTCKVPEVPNIAKLPEFDGQSLLADSIGSFRSAGKDVYNGNLTGAKAKANTLGKNAARITRLRDALVDKFNKDRKVDGKSGVDFEDLSNKFEDGLIKQVESAFDNLSPSEQEKLAHFAPGLGNLASPESEQEASEDDLAKGNSNSANVASADVNPNAGSVGKSAGADGGTWDFSFDEEQKSLEEQKAIAEALAGEDENYVVEGDISEDRHKDIFKIITRRYLKTAYPVIFEAE